MSKQEKPNVILMVVDQMRADSLGINSDFEWVSTPTLDMMASEGYNFENAYSPVPTCIPARAALLTGLNQENSGRVGYEECINWEYENTLPRFFTNNGYQTECVGKMHVYPARNRLGFEHVLLHDGYLHVERKYFKPYGEQFEFSSDYISFVKENLGHNADIIDNGLNCNSWEARVWGEKEKYHPTNWVVSESIKFLQRRDPTKPFFLKMSFEKPHAPLDPPAYYFDMYMNSMPEDIDLHIGNWEKWDGSVPNIYTLKGKLKKDDRRRMLAGYFGLISHIDHQISRFLTALKEFGHDKDTIILFVSDHGDQLGEHYLFRKAFPYQGSIHIPLFIYDPANIIKGSHKKIKELVKLQDIFPTLTDLVLQKDPEVDGKSVKPLLFGDNSDWREEFHGEHSLGLDSSQFVMTSKWKFIWYSVTDVYQLFDIENDPHEMNNLAGDKSCSEVFNNLKAKLINYLEGREEGFVKDGDLQKVDISKIKATLSRKQ